MRLINYIYACILISLAGTLVSCGSGEEDFQSAIKDNGKRECILDLNLSMETRGEETDESFMVGDILYFYFPEVYDYPTTATYKDDKLWHIEIPESMKEGSNGLCNILYAENGVLNHHWSGPTIFYVEPENTPIYGTLSAYWSYNGDVLKVQALLKPLQTKIQFVADDECDVMVKGLSPMYQIAITDFSFRISDAKRPCYPQMIHVGIKQEDGTYISEPFYAISIAGGHIEGGCQHSITYLEKAPCPIGNDIYLYNRKDTTNCYKREWPKTVTIGSSHIIKIPSTASMGEWEKMDNVIKAGPSSIFFSYQPQYESSLKLESGYSVNFSLKKTSSSDTILYIGIGDKDGNYSFFNISAPNNEWENYSAVVTPFDAIEKQLVFEVYDTRPWTSFGLTTDDGLQIKDVTYSHFPIYSLDN